MKDSVVLERFGWIFEQLKKIVTWRHNPISPKDFYRLTPAQLLIIAYNTKCSALFSQKNTSLHFAFAIFNSIISANYYLLFSVLNLQGLIGRKYFIV